ncbi:MAG: hypothetical protein HY885_11845 [Deltaproteobacteria bacterium]|nr:hypothetical protein [Deltaproteobacteria bacterium]
MDERQKALEEVRNLSPDATNFHIVNLHPDFFDGTLYVVGFEEGDKIFHNYVFVNSSGCHLSKNEALLLSMVAKKSKKSHVIELLGGISGIIGLIVTLTIVYIVVRDPKAEIPQILSTALTAILGFYFGSKSSR